MEKQPCASNVSRCRPVGRAPALGEVASAHCVRLSEHNEALRSTSEIRQYRVVGHRKRATKAFFNNLIFISRCRPVGRAPALGAGCRRFESCHLDQYSLRLIQNESTLIFLCFFACYRHFYLFKAL